LHFTPVKIEEEWSKFASQYLDKSAAFLTHVWDFRFVTLFRNQNGSKATVMKNLGQNLEFLTPSVKIREGVSKMSESFCFTFDGSLIGRLGDQRLVGKKNKL